MMMHHGSAAAGGHYTATVWCGQQLCVSCDDMKITPQPLAHALAPSSAVYLVMYAREGKFAVVAACITDSKMHIKKTDVFVIDHEWSGFH